MSPYPDMQIHQMHKMKITTNGPRAFRKLVLVHSPRNLAILVALLCFHGLNFVGPGWAGNTSLTPTVLS